MILWIDAQLSPALARWIRDTFHIEAQAVRDLGLRHQPCKGAVVTPA